MAGNGVHLIVVVKRSDRGCYHHDRQWASAVAMVTAPSPCLPPMPPIPTLSPANEFPAERWRWRRPSPRYHSRH